MDTSNYLQKKQAGTCSLRIAQGSTLETPRIEMVDAAAGFDPRTGNALTSVSPSVTLADLDERIQLAEDLLASLQQLRADAQDVADEFASSTP